MKGPDRKLLQEALAQVPGAEPGRETDLQWLTGGTTNATFRVHTAAGDFVVRLHEPYTADLGVDRQREATLHSVAAKAGLASRVLAADPAGRYMVTDFLPGRPWSPDDLNDGQKRSALIETLRAVHKLPAPTVPPLSLMELLLRHVAVIGQQDNTWVEDLTPQLARAQGILEQQRQAGRKPSIIHGDPSHGNLIGERPWLIDWEYASVGDPLADLACLVAYYPQLLAQGEALLKRCGLDESASLRELEDLAWVFGLLSNLWHRRLALAGRHPPPAH